MISIAKKEILEHLTSERFYILTGLLIVLMALSLIVSYGDYQLRAEHYALNHPQPNSSNIMIPPTALSIFAKGVDSNIGRLYYITERGIEGEDTEQTINRLFALFTVPDMLFIIKVMLSLIALLISFDGITGEKESGTLKLALSSGSNRSSILFGKILGKFLLVFVPFAVLFLISAVIVSVLPDVQRTGDYWYRIIYFLFASTIYIFIFTGLGIFLSSLVHRSSTSLVLCLTVWIFFIFLIPQMGITLGRAMIDVPTGERVEMQSRLASIRAIYERIQQDKENTMNGWKKLVNDIQTTNSEMLDTYRPKLNHLIRVTTNIARCSPAGALTFIVTDGANTGVYEEMRYKDGVSMFAGRNFELINNIKKGTMENFQYERAPLGEVISRSVSTDIILLFVFSFGFIICSMISFSRYDPR
ncbi:MAG: ABC transporter permease [Bacteroidota bacterium]